MNAEVGPLTVSALGVVAGAVAHTLSRRFWIASAVATLAAAAAWLGGCYAFLAIMAPGELGGPLPLSPVLLTVGNAFIAVLAAGALVRIARVAVKAIHRAPR